MSQELSHDTTSRSSRRMGAELFGTRRGRCWTLLALAAVVLGLWWVSQHHSPHHSPPGPSLQSQALVPEAADSENPTRPAEAGHTQPHAGSTEPPQAVDSLSDEELSRRLVGHWESERGGKRELVVHADGTAHMDVTITTYHKMLFGERVEFDGRWSIQDGELHFETTGGKPQWSVKAVTSVYGKSRVHPILKLTEDELVLKDDKDGEPNHEYRRVSRR